MPLLEPTVWFWDLECPRLHSFKSPDLLSWKFAVYSCLQWSSCSNLNSHLVGLGVLFGKLTLFNRAAMVGLCRFSHLWIFFCWFPARSPRITMPILWLSMFFSGGIFPCGHCGWESHVYLGCDFSNLLNFSLSKITCLSGASGSWDLCQWSIECLFWKMSTGR
jgi:hypothetical protein